MPLKAELRQANAHHAAGDTGRLAAEIVAMPPAARLPPPDPIADQARCQARALFDQLLDHDIDQARAVFRLFVQFAQEAGLVTPS